MPIGQIKFVMFFVDSGFGMLSNKRLSESFRRTLLLFSMYCLSRNSLIWVPEKLLGFRIVQDVKPFFVAETASKKQCEPIRAGWWACTFARLGLLGLLIVILLCSCEPTSIPVSTLELQTDSIYNSLADNAELQRGYAVYRAYGCVLCHGANGTGGVKNINAQTGEEIPAMTYIAEGYTIKEFKARIRKGVAHVARLDSLGEVPPYAMPGFNEMKNTQLNDLRLYVWSLYPNDEEDDW